MYSLHKRLLMPTADAIFKAIAHPARREILFLLSVSNRSVKELTAVFEMSQPAISQHLRELRDAKLVASERVGLEQQYRLTAGPLKAVFNWASQYRRFFDSAGHAWAFAPVEEKPRPKSLTRGDRVHGR
jgi:DNA-binding transcriptional ArsR family regulator